MKDPTPRMLDVLRALRLAAPRAMTANEIGIACGFRSGSLSTTHGDARTTHARDGRVMGPAQRVIGALTALRRTHGFVEITRRPDGLSGTAYRLTAAGAAFCREGSL